MKVNIQQHFAACQTQNASATIQIEKNVPSEEDQNSETGFQNISGRNYPLSGSKSIKKLELMLSFCGVPERVLSIRQTNGVWRAIFFQNFNR